MLKSGDLKVAVDIRQSQLQTGSGWIDCDTQLGTFMGVCDVEQIPGHQRRLSRTEGALKAELVGEALGERIHGPQGEIRLFLQTIGCLQITRSHYFRYAFVVGLSVVQLKFAD